MNDNRKNDRLVWFCTLAQCSRYNSGLRECNLLRNGQMEEFWETCQPNNVIIFYEALQKSLQSIRKDYPSLPIDDAEEIDFDGTIRRLKTCRLTFGFDLETWSRYVSRVVKNEIKKNLMRRGLLPYAHACGSCGNLSKSKPYLCKITGEARKKTAKTCENGYIPDIAKFTSIDGASDVAPLNDRRQSEIIDALAERHAFPTLESILEEIKRKLTIVDMERELAKRAEKAKKGSKARQKRERQHLVFVNYLDLLSKDIPRNDVVKKLHEQSGINKKTIRRDMEEIRIFFQKKCPFGAELYIVF